MRRILVPTVVLAIGLALAGCSSSGSGAASSAIGSAPQAGDSAAFGGTAPKPGGAANVIARQVITTGTLYIKTAHPVTAGDNAAHIVEAAGGRVDDRTESAATKHDRGSASLTLRIPSSNLTATLDALKKLGTVESLKLSTQDVTTQNQDLNARIRALQTTVDRLLALESKARTTTDLLAIENDISSRQADLDSLTSQEKYLSDQIDMATITLQFNGPLLPVKTTPPAPADAFTAGLSGFGTFFTWVFLVISYLVPWLVLAAVITFATIYFVRWRRKRRPAAPIA